MGNRIGHLQIAVRPQPASVNDALWNSFVVEVSDLLPEGKILQERGTPLPGFKRILIVRDDNALIGGKRSLSFRSDLVRSASRSRREVFLAIFEFSKRFIFVVFAIDTRSG
jgi:hypothetical protein